MDVVAIIIRLLLAVIFFRAAWHKFHHRTLFQSELAAYQLIKQGSLTSATIFLMIVETYTALMLLNISSFTGPLLASILLLLYADVMAINIRKGKTDISCGCGGPLAARKMISWSLVLRNIILSCMSIFALLVKISTLKADNNLLLILASATCTLLMYEAIEQAIANSQRYRQWQTKQMVKS